MDLEQYFSNKLLKKTKDIPGVYFEQKITPDLLSFAAQCVLEFVGENTNVSFTDLDLRSLDFYKMIIRDFLSKPSDSEKTRNEYNKVISYQLGFLTFSGVLEEIGQRPKQYKIRDINVLKFIAVHERQSLLFIESYIEKFISDNNLQTQFDSYREDPTQRTYEKLKDDFYGWAKNNTNVRTDDKKHTFRVFNKIFNFYTHKHSLPGQYLSRVKPGPNPYMNLIYNRVNFRDKNKAKNISRNEFAESYDPSENSGYISYLIGKAKGDIRKRYPTTEVTNSTEFPSEGGDVVQIHHIFPAASFQEFASSRENLIAISPGQHNTHGHLGNTHRINPKFQIACLKVRLNEIEKCIENNDNFFSLESFVSMVNSGLKLNIGSNADINSVKEALKLFSESIS